MPARRSIPGPVTPPVVVEISDRSLPAHMRLGGFRARMVSRPAIGRGITPGLARRLALALLYTPLLMTTLRGRSRQLSG